MNTGYDNVATSESQSRIVKIVEALKFAFGGASQVPLESLALALVGQVQNNGLFSTVEMQYYNREQAALFKERIDAGIKYAAFVFDEENDLWNSEEIRNFFWKHYKMPIPLARLQ